MTFVNRIGFALAGVVMLAGTSSQAQLTIQGIQLFNATALPQTDTNRGDEALSIDGNPNTFSYLTPSYAFGQRFAGLDFGSLSSVNRIQISKYADVDGDGVGPDPVNLQLLYTTDTGPISGRHYQPVTGLTNGYLGGEQVMADSVNGADATVTNDITNGIYSLSFNSVSATGLALNYQRQASPWIENYYPTAEFKPMNGATPQAVSSIDIWRPAIPAGGANFARGTQYGVIPTDEQFAIDGDTNTSTYLTRSYTDTPTAITLDLGSATKVNRVRVDKVTDQVTGSGISEPMNVQILYTTDTGPMNQRTFHTVSSLHNGFNGTELINAQSVNSSTATVNGEIQLFARDGWFSLTFGEVNATAIEYLISKPDGSANNYINYPIAEFQLYDSPGVVLGVPGDYNNNGVVDVADYVLWRKGGPLQNEVNTPGTVDASDYDAWRARFGNTTGSGSGSLDGGAVPEPSTALLALLAIATTAAIGRGRRSSPGACDSNP